MEIQQQLITELDRRAHLLQQELEVWNRLTESPTSGMGIHRSQIDAVELLYSTFQEKQQEKFNAVVEARGTEAFQTKIMALEQELMGTHGVMAVFRMILGQRSDSRFYRAALDAADLVAADCYLPCMRRAVAWGAIDANFVRVPPLTYLNTLYSPTAISRAGTFGAFKMPIEGILDLPMPIGVLSLPFHHTEAIWTFCTLYHEVGHLIDTDLKLREELRPRLESELAASSNKAYWSNRLREMVADTFGVLLGGEGFVRTMVKLLYQPPDMVRSIDWSDVHPNPHVRVFLLSELLSSMHNRLADEARSIKEMWRGLYEHAEDLEPYVEECDGIAHVLLDQRLDALQGKAIREFAPENTLEKDRRRLFELSRFLRSGSLRPRLEQAGSPFPVRLVPAAAQLAVGEVTDNHARTFELIHTRALEFIDALRAALPKFLGPSELSERRRRSLRALVEQIDLSRLREQPA